MKAHSVDSAAKESRKATKPGGALAPLRLPTFRAIWSASLISNFGTMIQSVGASWEMTRLTSHPEMVALVQTATLLPLMLVAVPAGAIADLFDRRIIALVGLCIASTFAMTLSWLSFHNLISPWALLSFCALIGVGVAIYGPSWQASVREQVSKEDLPAAIALGAINNNLARSFGPAIGGAIVVAAGASAAFAINTVSYFPLIAAFLLWRRPADVTTHARERIDRAIISGMRFVRHSPPARTVVLRAFAVGAAGAATTAFLPLIARNILHGDASTFGLLLGAYGVGAVAGAFLLGRLVKRWSSEALIRACTAAGGLFMMLVSLSHLLIVTCLLLILIGAVWIIMIATLNVGVQLSTPSWVTARALAWFTTALTGGIALGAWFWGRLGASLGLEPTIALSGFSVLGAAALGFLLPLPRAEASTLADIAIAQEPEPALPLTARSGPISIEHDYTVAHDKLEEFLFLMQAVQSARLRLSAFDWTLERDIGDSDVWTERYYYPTWGDYLRQRTRFTEADHKLYRGLGAFRTNGPIRRRLARPPSVSIRKDETGPLIEDAASVAPGRPL